MIHHTSRIDARCSEVNLLIFGDLQYGAEGFQEESWQQFRHEFKTTKNAYALGLGDYCDFLRPSMRTRLYSSLTGDDSARQQLDNLVRKHQDQFIKKMDFLEGRLVGLHQGHHEYEWASGGNTTQRLCSALKTAYLGWIAGTRLTLHFGKNKKHANLSYTILSTHGNTNAKKVTTAAGSFEQSYVESFIVDHYIMGHACKSAAWTPSERNIERKWGPPGSDTVYPRCLMVGGFCKGYTDGFSSSYVERNGMKPQPVGWGLITLKIIHDSATQKLRGKSPTTKLLRVDQLNRHPNVGIE